MYTLNNMLNQIEINYKMEDDKFQIYGLSGLTPLSNIPEIHFVNT